ncbi:MAG: hypothetical protein K9H63_03445, partial [Sphingobacteriaceae bacterium]|nr:hypothetical protein [Sphingobacteriaceae bacterium]
EAELEAELKQLQSIINTPFRWFRTIRNLFSQTETSKSDIVSSLTQLGLPILLNSVIFKKSSLVIKGLVAIISQQLARGVTAKNVTSWIETLMGWVKNAEKLLVKKVEETIERKGKK